MSKGPDTQGGSKEAVQPKDLSQGEQAEKGDAHREYRQHTGKTRGGTTQDDGTGTKNPGGHSTENDEE